MESPKPLDGSGAALRIGKDVALRGRLGGLTGKSSELPRELIESGSERVRELSNEHSDSLDTRRVMDLIPEDVLKILDIVVGRDSVGLRIEERFSPVLDLVDLRFRPLRFHLQIDNTRRIFFCRCCR